MTREGYVYTGPVPNGPKIGSYRPSVCTGSFCILFGTDPKLDVKLWIRSGPVPERFRVDRSRSGSVRNGSGPVPCKHSLEHCADHNWRG